MTLNLHGGTSSKLGLIAKLLKFPHEVVIGSPSFPSPLIRSKFILHENAFSQPIQVYVTVHSL